MAGHLVLPIQTPTPPGEALEQLRQAHRFLVAAARDTVPRFMKLPSETWGSDAKREHVVLPVAERPQLVSKDVADHSFIEVLNQCATLERLLDTLAWINTVAELQQAMVVLCNPTTSSASRKKGEPRPVDDHDLVLEDRAGVRWKFEVSAVASEKDGNGKEKKDLVSLGVLPEDGSDVSGWPSGRCHLVVSEEFARRLREPTRHGLRLGLFHYAEVKAGGDTRIFEVRQGPKPT
ncbi:MAG: hypothetical protein L6Q84_02430 [Polyangiaceae bacterium]|nr:hypothetical protein [Polyangiaceae bacterium]